MLSELHVSGFAVVEEITLEFGPGFTALTGETGAGKSIIVDALGLALGERSDPDNTRPGRTHCEVAARFQVDADTAALLDEWDYPCDGDELLVRRVLRTQGSRAWLNGSPIPLKRLREVAENLVEVRGQHSQLRLLSGAHQRELLDGYAAHDALLADVAERYREWHALQQRLDQLQSLQRRTGELSVLRHYVTELEELGLQEEELEQLEQEQARLNHSHHLTEALGHILERLDSERGLGMQLGTSYRELLDCARLDRSLEPLVAELQQAQELTDGITRRLADYLGGLEVNADRLREVEQRLDALQAVAHKHRVPAHTLPDKLAALQAELEALESAGQDRSTWERQAARALQRYLRCTRTLSTRRSAAATRMGEAITAAIQRLGMPKGQCSVAVHHQPDHAPGRHGMDQIEFMATANPGMPLRPLARAVSGGELSRIYLAAYSLAHHKGAGTTLVFDEIDTGIGGAVAELIGRLLCTLAASRQVLCITHLPQVACLARHHLRVNKHTTPEGNTRTEVQTLDEAQRIQEVARMLGGLHITDRTLAHAREMLHGAAPADQACNS